MNQLKRGFKTWCENASAGYRRDLKLQAHAALEPEKLARHLGVQIVRPNEIPGLDKKSLQQLLETEPESWSAVTIIVGTAALIIVNSSHPLTRRNSSLAHELAHIVLRHEPTHALLGPEGALVIKEYNRQQEEEADCLAGVLLVPRTALLALLPQMCEQELAGYFGVSGELLRMRRNLSGVERQLAARLGATVNSA